MGKWDCTNEDQRQKTREKQNKDYTNKTTQQDNMNKTKNNGEKASTSNLVGI